MVERLFRALGESADDPQGWTREQAVRYLNDAYNDFARDTGALEIRTTIRAIASQGEYEIPENVGPVMRVAFDDYELQGELAHQMDRKVLRWQTQTGVPERWVKSREGRHKFRVWRIPADSGPYAVSGEEYGKLVSIAIDTEDVPFNAEVGKLIDMQGSGVTFRVNQELGRLCRLEFTVNNFEIWGKEIPAPLEFDDAEPDILPVAHMGIVFRAAALMLSEEREGRNEALAAVYDALADENEDYIRFLVNSRLPERVNSPRRDIDARHNPFSLDNSIPIPVSLQP
jgi:hypothetical protein